MKRRPLILGCGFWVLLLCASSAWGQTHIQDNFCEASNATFCDCPLSNVGTGHFIVVTGSVQSSHTVSTITSTAGDTFAQNSHSPQNNSGNAETYLYAVYNSIAQSGTDNFRITYSSSANTLVSTCSEWSGMLTSGVEDTSVSANYSSTTTPSAGSVTIAQAKELLIGTLGNNAASCSETFTANNGYTLLHGASNSRGAAEYKMVSSTGTYSDGWSLSNSCSGAAILGAYKASTGGSACTPTLTLMGVGRCG